VEGTGSLDLGRNEEEFNGRGLAGCGSGSFDGERSRWWWWWREARRS